MPFDASDVTPELAASVKAWLQTNGQDLTGLNAYIGMGADPVLSAQPKTAMLYAGELCRRVNVYHEDPVVVFATNAPLLS